MTKPYTIIRRFFFWTKLVGMMSLDRNHWELTNLSFVLPMYLVILKTEKILQFWDKILGVRGNPQSLVNIAQEQVSQTTFQPLKADHVITRCNRWVMLDAYHARTRRRETSLELVEQAIRRSHFWSSVRRLHLSGGSLVPCLITRHLVVYHLFRDFAN